MKKRIAIVLTLMLATGTFTACTAEEKVNDINKAAAITLYKLSRALLCSVEDLLETPILN